MPMRKLKELLLRWRLKRGKATYGRLPGQAETKIVGTLSARVIRANGDIEDLGDVAVLRKERI